MRRSRRRWWLIAGGLASLLILPVVIQSGLRYEPPFYRQRLTIPPQVRKDNADRFVSQSLQLRNDIANEDRWEAVFSEEEVNAWMSEDLVGHFSDQLPPEVSEPVVAFELDQITLAFKMNQGPIRSLVWVVARARVVSGNRLALTLDKVRAGFLPVPADTVIDHLTAQAKAYGLDLQWEEEEGKKVAFIQYSPAPGRLDVILDRVQILDGRLYISGRSNRGVGRITQISLPTRSVLQSTFPVKNSSQRGRSGRPATSPSSRRSTAIPVT